MTSPHSMRLIEAILQQKTDLDRENERLQSQLLWLSGIVRNVATRPDTPPAIVETLNKALKVIGAPSWLTTSPPEL